MIERGGQTTYFSFSKSGDLPDYTCPERLLGGQEVSDAKWCSTHRSVWWNPSWLRAACAHMGRPWDIIDVDSGPRKWEQLAKGNQEEISHKNNSKYHKGMTQQLSLSPSVVYLHLLCSFLPPNVRLYFLGSQITTDGNCSHEIKRHLLLGRKVMTNLNSIFKSRDITLPRKVCLVKAMVFPVVMYECESWTVKKAEHRKIVASELWCWRRLLRVPWTARRSNQSILKEISPGCSLEGW